MRRTEVYKTAQFWLTILGSWLIVAGWVATRPQQDANTNNVSNRPSRLQVVPATRSSNQDGTSLQGAGTLQSQAAGGLQQPSTSDLLQPNAKTDSFGTDTVQ